MPNNSVALYQTPPDKKQEELEELDRRSKIAVYAITGEFLFILLPLLIIGIVEFSKGSTLGLIFESTELSFGAAVMFGQSIVKLVAGFSSRKPKSWEKPALSVSLIIVFGLAPTLTVLALTLALDPVPHCLKVAQLPIFIYGTIVFFSLGRAGHAQCHVKTRKQRKMQDHA